MKPITKIRAALLLFIVFLVLSGVTAFPLRTELAFLMHHQGLYPDFMAGWIGEIHLALQQTPDLVLYGTDWLAFAHLIIALFFVPVYVDPVRYKANLLVAIAACAAVFVLAFICGPIRGIPFFHQLIDCSFGLLGFFPLYFVYKTINQLPTPSQHSV